ncbi:reverse transcriptase [Lasius niger]|uniref:Reverse transcriptase n=1 Tax=Lasius niger TaxID=67767 RepID=A0A0J7KEN2_LASNI|nr:reverse transcriptase [Lasius niger]
MRSWLNRVMKKACGASAPRFGMSHESEGGNGRVRLIGGIPQLPKREESAKKELCREIAKAKSTAWRELIFTIDADPWGLPCKVVLNRLERQSPTLTETLDEKIVDRLLSSLFPPGGAQDLAPLTEWQKLRCEEGQLVQLGETLRYMK